MHECVLATCFIQFKVVRIFITICKTKNWLTHVEGVSLVLLILFRNIPSTIKFMAEKIVYKMYCNLQKITFRVFYPRKQTAQKIG